ncbi:MAG: FAD-binding oxidoreductase [Flavobacteriales bacterium]|nr:FAD-binding oxidoreductase [Flavobacteriales bacterium]MCX7767845.1 FAD-binding oxidoreductase [Flavobacteriales bacterium]MDW8410657.1 FAD-dependent oxidoreductase [Flavobacteriales bacterium]
MVSYWEHKIFFPPDVVLVAGAGITGLSAALYLKQRLPELSITVLDAGIPPGGATTRNAGFACIGSLTELLDDVSQHGQDQALNLSLRRLRGLERLRQLLGDKALSYQPCGNYEIFFPEDTEILEKALAWMPQVNEWFASRGYSDPVFQVVEAPKGLPADAKYILNRLEGVLDSGRLYMELSEKARKAGITLVYGLKIKSFKEDAKSVLVNLEGDDVIICRALALCTNAFARQLVPSLPVEPARGVVMVSEVCQGFEKITPAGFHHHMGYNYFRFLDGRLLIGGGRHLFLKREFTLNPEPPGDIQRYLAGLAARITGQSSLRFQYVWTGFMGKGPSKDPLIQPLGQRVFCAVRLGGMGVALGCEVGETLADLMVSHLV